MKKDRSVRNWRKISRKGVFEVLHALEGNGRMRFKNISKEANRLCLATLTGALTSADELGLIRKTSYKIADDGSLKEITEADLEAGVRPQATFYTIEEKGKGVLKLKEKLGDLLGSTEPGV